jgi:hypothetical protein
MTLEPVEPLEIQSYSLLAELYRKKGWMILLINTLKRFRNSTE